MYFDPRNILNQLHESPAKMTWIIPVSLLSYFSRSSINRETSRENLIVSYCVFIGLLASIAGHEDIFRYSAVMPTRSRQTRPQSTEQSLKKPLGQWYCRSDPGWLMWHSQQSAQKAARATPSEKGWEIAWPRSQRGVARIGFDGKAISVNARSGPALDRKYRSWGFPQKCVQKLFNMKCRNTLILITPLPKIDFFPNHQRYFFSHQKYFGLSFQRLSC